MSRWRSSGSYGHSIQWIGFNHYRLHWTVDRHYSGSRLRHPRGASCDTDLDGAMRFAKKWQIALPACNQPKEKKLMPELSDSGRKVIQHALKGDGFLFTNSGGLTGGVAQQVRASLLKNGLIEEVKHSGNGDLFNGKALKVTDAGIAAVGGQKPAAQADEAAPAPPTATEAQAKARTPRENSKTAQLISKLRDPNGASIDELCSAFGWQPHTTRAAIATLPKKDSALKATSEKIEGRGRVYKLPALA